MSENLPPGFVSVADYIAELRRDPEHAKTLDEAREPVLRDIIRALLDRLADRDALAERCEKLREDAERWEKLVELWHASTELQLTQDEDGWSITVIEAVEAEPAPGRWTGDTPDEAIDALGAPKDAP